MDARIWQMKVSKASRGPKFTRSPVMSSRYRVHIKPFCKSVQKPLNSGKKKRNEGHTCQFHILGPICVVFSINKNTEVKVVTTPSTTSRHEGSILVFQTLGPVKKLPRFSPLYQTMYSPTLVMDLPIWLLPFENKRELRQLCCCC